jgi:dTDP-glucose 4,6-dehydratase
MASEAAVETVLVTGGAGFIGTNFVLKWCATDDARIVNLDKLTYAGNAQNLESLADTGRHQLVVGDIADRQLVRDTLREHRPVAIVNFAAESHVDRSIHGPEDFIQTNLVGTFHLIEEARAYWQGLPPGEAENFRFLHVSTDEVYGSLGPDDPPFTETTPYAPNSPYSASKAGSDHLVRAYFHTYGFPSLTTNCSNNYGPYQFPEKLIPLMIMNALSSKPLPVYGDGLNVRDWLYVEDHCAAIRSVLRSGKPGETYNISGDSERRNIDVVRTICTLLDELHPSSPIMPHEKLITYVKDRPGHDRRYAMDATKLRTALGWKPIESFESGMRKTIEWYLKRPEWVARVTAGNYGDWMQLNYGNRLPT